MLQRIQFVVLEPKDTQKKRYNRKEATYRFSWRIIRYKARSFAENLVIGAINLTDDSLLEER